MRQKQNKRTSEGNADKPNSDQAIHQGKGSTSDQQPPPDSIDRLVDGRMTEKRLNWIWDQLQGPKQR